MLITPQLKKKKKEGGEEKPQNSQNPCIGTKPKNVLNEEIATVAEWEAIIYLICLSEVWFL